MKIAPQLRLEGTNGEDRGVELEGNERVIGVRARAVIEE